LLSFIKQINNKNIKFDIMSFIDYYIVIILKLYNKKKNF